MPRKPFDLNRMQIFREVVAAGSFTKAGVALGLPKSRVSRAIAALERDVGVPLVYRTTRSLRLTDAGATLYRKTSDALAVIDEALGEVGAYAEEVSGRLRVSVPEDIGSTIFGEICHEYLQTYPKVELELLVENRRADLLNDAIDVALRIGKLEDSGLKRRRVGVVRVIAVASPSLVARLGAIRAPKDLAELPYLRFAADRLGREGMLLTRGKEKAYVKPRGRLVANNFFALRAMAVKGAGWATIPAFLAEDEIHRGALVQLLGAWTIGEVPLQLVTPPHKELPPRVERFLELAAARLAPRFA